jgi:hypothetical protein
MARHDESNNKKGRRVRELTQNDAKIRQVTGARPQRRSTTRFKNCRQNRAMRFVGGMS